MTDDDELSAMQALVGALEPLDEAAAARVLGWAAARYGVPQPSEVRLGAPGATAEKPAYTDLGDLVEAVSPSNGPEYALAVAYWLQIIQDRPGWSGGEVNDVLKNLGRGAANITKTLGSLMARKPALVMQTAKTGRAQQARKTYKLTAAGIRAIDDKLRDDNRGEDQ